MILLLEIIKKIYKKKGYEYWNAYLQSYIAEMESHPMHYVLIKGIDVRQDEEEQNNKFLGIYDGLARLEDAYVVAVQKLEEQHKNMTGLLGDKVDYIVKHEKIMINVFDEFTGRWHYNVKPEQLFWRKNADTDNYKMVECVFDNPYMYEVKLDKIKRTLSGERCSGMRLVIDMDDSEIIYKESGELPEQFSAYVFVYSNFDNSYSTIVGFYHPYYDNNKGGVFDGIGAYMEWDQIVAWKCLEGIRVNCISEDDTRQRFNDSK